MAIKANQWSDVIKHWRAAHGFKQEVAADVLGVSQSTLSRWEGAQSEPTAGARNRIMQMMRNLTSPVQTPVWLSILSTMPAAGSVIDKDGRFVAVTPPTLAACGLERIEVIGRRRTEIIAGETEVLDQRLHDEGIFRCTIAYGEVCHQFISLATGQEYWYHGVFWPHFGEAEVQYVVSIGSHLDHEAALRARDRLGGLFIVHSL